MVLVSSSLCARPPVVVASSSSSSSSTFGGGGGRKGGAIHRRQQPRRRAVVSSVVSPDPFVCVGSRGGVFGGPFTTRGGRSAPRKGGGVFWRRRTLRAKSFEMEEEETEESHTLSIATKLVHPKTSVEDPYAASAPPLYQTATFAQPNATENGRYDYTRSGNPSRDQLEEQFADIEGATRAFAFSSGMSALATVTRLVKNGERIVTGDDIYGGTSRLLAQVVPEVGIEVVNVDCTDLKAVEEAINGGPTTMVMLESPTNPRLQCIDVRKICEMAKKKGALVCVDNSIMTATFQNPLELGADISMVSATKFIAGHSDVTGGLLAVKGEELAKRVYFFQNACGTLLGPFDCWLALRGIKTMDLRMKKQQENAMKLAEWIENHPKVQRVNYPGLKSNPFHDLHFSQATGAGSILSFTTGDVNFSKTIVEETKLFKITVSFGGVTSLISLPCFMSHASIPAEVRAARGLPDDLVRISCGIEDAEDLLNDLKRAFEKAEKNTK